MWEHLLFFAIGVAVGVVGMLIWIGYTVSK